MISAIDLLAIALATGSIIDVWHNGSIFATWRAIVQAKQDVAAAGTIQAWWTELLMCPFCQSYHVALYLLILLLAGKYLGGMFDVTCHLVVYSLAATRLSNLVNGLLPEKMQYGRGQ